MNDFLIHGDVPVTLYSNFLTSRDSNESLKLDGDLFKTMTIYILNVGQSNLQHRKSNTEFAEEMNFDFTNIGRPSLRDKSLEKLLNSHAIMASGISTMFLPCDPNELCDRLKTLLQEKQAGINSNITNDEIIAIVDKLLQYKCISKKQHKQILVNCNLLHTEKNKHNTHKNVSIHKKINSYNCMYTQI